MFGTIPIGITKMTNLEVLVLSANAFTGRIPRGDDILPGDDEHVAERVGARWGDLTNLTTIYLNDNKLTGTLSASFLYGLAPSLVEMDIANNLLTGQLPTLLGKMAKLERIDAQNNAFNGTLPSEMNRMYPDIQLNLTNNL